MSDAATRAAAFLEDTTGLPDEFVCFLRALVRGLRDENRIPLDFRAFPCGEPVMPTARDGTWEYHISYSTGDFNEPGPRHITGRWS